MTRMGHQQESARKIAHRDEWTAPRPVRQTSAASTLQVIDYKGIQRPENTLPYRSSNERLWNAFIFNDILRRMRVGGKTPSIGYDVMTMKDLCRSCLMSCLIFGLRGVCYGDPKATPGAGTAHFWRAGTGHRTSLQTAHKQALTVFLLAGGGYQ